MMNRGSTGRLLRAVLGTAALLFGSPAWAAAEEARAREILQAAGVTGGLVVHEGCGDGALAAALRPAESYLVHGLDTDGQAIQKARERLHSLGVYGPVSVASFDGVRLPYGDEVVNLLVAEDLGKVPLAEVMRVLVPRGVGLVKLGGDAEKQLAACGAADVAAAAIGGERWTRFSKPWPKGIDEWTHFLHGPDNNAVAHDAAAGVPRHFQWAGGPRWGRSHEELASMSAAVSAKGRLFYIADEALHVSIRFLAQWKLIACDAFNGIELWKRDVGPWTDHLRHFRSGPLHLPRRLVAAGDEVYVTLGLGQPVAALDAATGRTLRTYEGTAHAEEILFQDGVLYLIVGSSEGQVTGGGLSRRGEPEATPFRRIAAVQADTGRQLWAAAESEFVLPLGLAVRGGRAVYQSTEGIVCLDAQSGKELWRAARATPSRRYAWSGPTLVVGERVVLCADRDVPPQGKPDTVQAATGPVQWAVHGWNVSGFPRQAKATLRAYGIADGKELWSCPCGEGYNSPVDVFIADGLVWVGPGFAQGRDPQTGEVKRDLSVKADPVGMAHHRCYRDKATDRFILTGRSGVEIISLTEGWLGNNSWVRGTCQYGIMPCNGLLYAPPDACACFPRAKVQGFNALRAGSAGLVPKPTPAAAPEIEKGPAYSDIPAARPEAADGADWPMYRHDAARSGAAATAVPDALKVAWTAEVGGRLTPPVVAGGMAIVAVVDAHRLVAFDAASGRQVWTCTAGGRIDSPPAIHGARVLFGCADGWVYCLRASDGALAWRFRAAPEERLVGAFGQLESVWPVHGAVLVQSGTVYATAGRSSYLDGGIRLYGLDPATGQQRSLTVVSHLDPATGKQLGAEARGSFDMEGTLSDILSGDGRSVYLKHLRFDGAGKEVRETAPHLLTATGFLGEEWFVRSYWILGTETGAGWGRWANAGNQVPAGRILCLDAEHVYGYGRSKYASGPTGHRAEAYHFFCTPKRPAAPARDDGAAPRKKRGGQQPAKTYRWAHDVPIAVRALALASDRLIAAGVPDAGKRTAEVLAFDNDEEARDAFLGKQGAVLWVVAAADGQKLSDLALEAPPVFDGLAAARGSVFVSLRNGKLVCLTGR